jgi:hypothetical protein
MPAEVGDIAGFWRRDPGGKSEMIQVEVLETIPETDWAYVRRLDNDTYRVVSLKRLKTLTPAPLTCKACEDFFRYRRCNKPDECDCPRCQGGCTCRPEPSDASSTE